MLCWQYFVTFYSGRPPKEERNSSASVIRIKIQVTPQTANLILYRERTFLSDPSVSLLLGFLGVSLMIVDVSSQFFLETKEVHQY
ncbi:unnamed protein product [Prunus armeniaca]